MIRLDRDGAFVKWLPGEKQVAPDALVRVDRAGRVVKALGRKYSPDQPRVPAGSPEGGQWVSAGETPREFHGRQGAIEWGEQYFSKWQGSLTSEETSALMAYTGEQYKNINGFARGQLDLSTYPVIEERVKRQISALDSALAKGKIPETIKVRRGACRSQECRRRFEMMRPGDEFIDKGFTSTSLGSGGFQGTNTHVHITIPAGSPGAFIGVATGMYKETEILLPRNSRFQVTGSRMDLDLLIVEMELVG